MCTLFLWQEELEERPEDTDERAEEAGGILKNMEMLLQGKVAELKQQVRVGCAVPTPTASHWTRLPLGGSSESRSRKTPPWPRAQWSRVPRAPLVWALSRLRFENLTARFL